MAMPKKRMSHARSGNRRSHLALRLVQLRPCSNCQTPGLTHRMCRQCGYYSGRAILERPKTHPEQPPAA